MVTDRRVYQRRNANFTRWTLDTLRFKATLAQRHHRGIPVREKKDKRYNKLKATNSMEAGEKPKVKFIEIMKVQRKRFEK